MKKYFLLLILITSGIYHNLVAMEERNPREYDLFNSKESELTVGPGLGEGIPAELNVYIMQFLGDTIKETLKNIVSLSQTNRYFHNLIKNNPNWIRSVVYERFGKEGVQNFFDDAIGSWQNNVIALLFKFGFISLNDILQNPWIFDLQQHQIMILLSNLRLLPDEPFIEFSNQFVTPLDFLIQQKPDLLLTGSPDNPFLGIMVNNDTDINQYVNGGVTPLYYALSVDNLELFSLLLDLGADPLKKNSNGSSVMQFISGNKSITNPYFLELKGRGYKVRLSHSIFNRRMHPSYAKMVKRRSTQRCA